jgi:phospholipid N-methyltransferase
MNFHQSRQLGRSRLLQLRERTNEAEAAMIDERARFTALARNEPTPAVVAFNLFQTPEDIAAQMVDALGSLDGCNVLEPSAGLGRLYRAIRQRSPDCPVTLVEVAPQCCQVLYGQIAGDPQARLLQGDFVTREAIGSYDRIVMNPPFKMGLDVRHILHARSLLKPGGLLVALCYNGGKQNAKLKPLASTWHVLPANSFRDSGTSASVAMLTLHASP